MPKRPTYASRPASADDRYDQVRGHLIRLRHACDEFDRDQNSPTGFELFALPIRLLVCGGRGNQLLQRVCGESGLDLPRIHIGRPPELDASHTFSVGSLPDEPDPEKNLNEVDLVSFLCAPCIALDYETERIEITWDEFLRVIPEKRGIIHSDELIPQYFDGLDRVIIGNANVVRYLFRRAVFAICKFCIAVLKSNGRPSPIEPPAAVGANLLSIGWFSMVGIYAPDPGQAAFQKRYDTALELWKLEQLKPLQHQLEVLLVEISSFRSLFYIRSRAVIINDLAAVAYNLGQDSTSNYYNYWLISNHAGAKDEGLKRVVAATRERIAILEGKTLDSYYP